MRKYSLYFLTALVAFSTGLFCVYLGLPAETVNQNIEVSDYVANFVDRPTSNESTLHKQTGIESLISDKEKAIMLFEPTLQKWLKGEKLARLVESSPEIVERISKTRLHRYEAPYLTDVAQTSYSPSLIDLNGDRNLELAVMIDRKGSDEGDLWLFKEIDGEFEVILQSREKLEQFDVKKSRSSGFFDIQTSYHPNDPQTEAFKRMTDYKFNGKEYTLRGCSAIVDRYRDRNGVDLHYLKKPVLEHYDDCC